MLTPHDYLKITLDPVRLALLGAAAVGTPDPAALATALDLDSQRISRELGKLRAVGLIDDEGRLDRRLLRSLAQELPQAEAPASSIVGEEWSEGERLVLSRFFRGSRLEAVPTQHAKRVIVLERLAQEFEPGVRYREPEVNFTLQMFHADYATLRRYLVDEGFLTRADGVYWRTGGRTVGHVASSDA
jgi:hypothetical protein